MTRIRVKTPIHPFSLQHREIQHCRDTLGHLFTQVHRSRTRSRGCRQLHEHKQRVGILDKIIHRQFQTSIQKLHINTEILVDRLLPFQIIISPTGNHRAQPKRVRITRRVPVHVHRDISIEILVSRVTYRKTQFQEIQPIHALEKSLVMHVPP